MSDNYYFVGQRAIKINDYYWIISSTTNAIWKCDLSLSVVDYLLFDKEIPSENLFRAVLCINDNIYCFPYDAKYAYKIDTDLNIVQRLMIDNYWCENVKRKFSCAFSINHTIIAVGRGIRGFLRYDVETGSAFLVDNGWPFLDEYVCSFSHGILNDMLYTVSVLDPSLVEFDYKNNTIVKYDFTEYCNKNLSAIMSGGGSLYIINDRSELLKLDDSLRVSELRKVDGLDSTIIRYAEIRSDGIIYVDNVSGCLMIEKEGDSKIIGFNADKSFGYCFTAVEMSDNKLLLQSRSTGKIYSYDFTEGTVDSTEISIGEELKEKYNRELIELFSIHGETMIENNNLKLSDFLGTLGEG